MIKETLQETLRQALENATFPDFKAEPAILDTLKLERPRNRDHGDYAVNVSSLARWVKMAPPKIAETLQQAIPPGDITASVIAGFINFQVTPALLATTLAHRLGEATPGLNPSCQGQRILLEFVSANPTGPLHIGHGRWAALGDSIRRILEHCGATVSSEFYINDAGVQVHNIGRTLWWRCQEALESGGRLPEPVEGQPYPFYPGDYVKDLAATYLAQHPEDKAPLLAAWEREKAAQAPTDEDLALSRRLEDFARLNLRQEQEDLLSRMGVHFDCWFSERTLHEAGALEPVLETIRSRGYLYEEDGALWFKSSALGDEKDRVLRKSDGSYTYLTADIAYAWDKYNRKHPDTDEAAFNRFLYIWGADHHGYIARLRAAIDALGLDTQQFEVLLGQLVNLIVDGEKTRMGKRRKMLTLADVIDEVGVDATRFWMVSKSADTALDFDVALAASATDENPVFYAQYAHARCASILRNAIQEQVNVNTRETLPPLFSEAALAEGIANATPETLAGLFQDLDDPKALETLKGLIFRLDAFEETVQDAARLRAPHLVARYALELSADFHSFYNVCRILTPDPSVSLPRLLLIVALKKTLGQALALLGVSAPERM